VEKQNATLTVHLDAIAHNVEVLQSYLQPATQQMAVIKANAYGHGAIKIAKHLEPKVVWFSVNDIHEAVELRGNGIRLPILVFGIPEEETAALYQEHKITATVSAKEHFNILPDGAAYHLNFDTGMGRLGFGLAQADEVKTLIDSHSNLRCTGIYSHFATAGEGDMSKMKNQFQAFKKLRSRLSPELITHMCNTAATMQLPEAQFDMIRTGIGLYGYAPGDIDIPALKPALSWESYLIQVNPIQKSETVSYGARWQCPADGFMGVIPVGYEDGIPRSLSGKFSVLIHEKKYPVVGTVTMNYCMIFLGRDELKPGSEVVLWNEEMNAGSWAREIGTIPYEILTGLPAKMPRSYSG
jgi:alanine racemase